MAVTPRILRSNLIQLPGSSLYLPSEDPAFPVLNLKDQARGRRVRTKVGHTFVPGVNDALHFSTADGPRVAHIAPGNYSTGAAAAAAVQTALNGAGYNPRTALSGLTAWWMPEGSALDASGLVSSVSDFSGNSRTLSQATPSARPLFVASPFDGRPAWYFDGTAGLQLVSGVNMSTLLGGNGVGTILVLFRLDSDAAASDSLWFAGSGSQFAWLMWTGTTNFDAQAFDTANRIATKSAASGVSAVQHGWWEYDQTTLQAYVGNANTAAVGSTAMTGALHANILGSTFKLGSVGGSPLKGYVFGLLIYNRALAEFERRGIVNYLRQRRPSMVDATTAAGWTVTLGATYASSKFTISRTGGAGNIALETSSAVPAEHKAAAAYPDLGYTTAADKTAATTYTAENVSYQSRHAITVDLGAAAASTAGVVLDHNSGAGGTLTVQGNSANLWTAPPLSELLSGDDKQRSDYWASVSYRFLRLLVDDTQNAAGYFELGVWYVGTYDQPPKYSPRFSREYDDLSGFQRADFGAGHGDERPQAGVWSVHWRNLTDAQKAALEAFQEAVPRSKSFFFLFDAAVPANIRYVNRPAPLRFDHNERSALLWETTMGIVEALP